MLATLLRRRPRLAWTLAIGLTVVVAIVVVQVVDTASLSRAVRAAASDPGGVALAVGAFGLAFVLRAVAWRAVLPDLGFGHALAAIHVALGGNHVLPARLGELLRVTSVVRRAGVGLEGAAASTLTLRAADVVALVGLATVVGAGLLLDLAGGWVAVVAALAVAALGVGVAWLRRVGERTNVRLPGPRVAGLAVAAWVLEAVVVHRAAAWAGVELAFGDALLVTLVTVAGQLLAVTPGGFGTYEAAGTAALVALGVPASVGLAVVVTAHATKTAYSLVAGAVGLVVPAPGMFGRLRLPRWRPRAIDPSAVPDGPVVLFLPAHDEQATIADVVGRAPRTVHDRRVEVVVVDDGSSDATAARAAAAGASVVSSPVNRGLGAAVRTGFEEALARGASVVAFCDADGEYAPEELERLAAPILAGEADYVVGSRFEGRIDRMLPHRRLGNRTLTLLLRFVSRTRVSDGQSGYRALSRDAAAAAEIVHDYNYAQVLTLDLLAKGFRYAEVPISYRFREQGTSFVRLGRYLGHVVPAVWREVNGAGASG